MNNREAAVVISGEAAEYYQSLFDADWEGMPLQDSMEKVTGYVFSQPSQLLIAAVVIIVIITGMIAVFVTKKK